MTTISVNSKWKVKYSVYNCYRKNGYFDISVEYNNLELKNFHTAEVITDANKRISQIDARIERSKFVEELEGSITNNCYE